jgi:hypothetical protein
LVRTGEWRNVLEEARGAIRNPRLGGFDDALIHIAHTLDRATMDYTGPVVVAQTGDRRITDAMLKRYVEEELDHAKQMRLPRGLEGLPVSIFDRELVRKAAEGLRRFGYPKLDPKSPFYEHNTFSRSTS